MPGRPMAFGRIGKAWLFGLPGNPVAVMVSYTQFALDALLRLSGLDPVPERPLLTVTAANAIRKQAGRREYLRGTVVAVDGRWQVKTTGNQGSGVLRSMSEANCFVVLPEDCAGVQAGDVAVPLPRPRDRRDPALGRARSEVLTLLNGAQQDYHDIAPDIAAAPPAAAPINWSKLSFAV